MWAGPTLYWWLYHLHTLVSNSEAASSCRNPFSWAMKMLNRIIFLTRKYCKRNKKINKLPIGRPEQLATPILHCPAWDYSTWSKFVYTLISFLIVLSLKTTILSSNLQSLRSFHTGFIKKHTLLVLSPVFPLSGFSTPDPEMNYHY